MISLDRGFQSGYKEIFFSVWYLEELNKRWKFIISEKSKKYLYKICFDNYCIIMIIVVEALEIKITSNNFGCQPCPQSNIGKIALVPHDFARKIYLVWFINFKQSKLIYAIPGIFQMVDLRNQHYTVNSLPLWFS